MCFSGQWLAGWLDFKPSLSEIVTVWLAENVTGWSLAQPAKIGCENGNLAFNQDEADEAFLVPWSEGGHLDMFLMNRNNCHDPKILKSISTHWRRIWTKTRLGSGAPPHHQSLADYT